MLTAERRKIDAELYQIGERLQRLHAARTPRPGSR
jgi:hypothetical protein